MTKPIVAAFDFDGTLTYRDTLLPFIGFCKGKLNTALCTIDVLPSVACFAFGSKTRQQVKERLLANAFAGCPYAKLLENGVYFSQQEIQRRINPTALKKLIWHQNQGHRCILISATLDVYLLPWAKKKGFNDLLCSRLEVLKGGTVTGKLLGLNCWGAEKVARIEKLLGPKDKYLLYAYGDSKGDYELLKYADYAFYRSFE